MKLVVDENEVSFNAKNLPIMIHGKDGHGASHFSLCVISGYLSEGQKIVFFTRFPGAAVSFKELCAQDADIYLLESNDKIAEAAKHQAVIIKSGDTKLCEDYISQATDIQERVVFLKNVEAILTDGLWCLVESSDKLVLSGDINKSQFKEQVLNKKFNTKVLFSEIKNVNSYNFQNLTPYSAYISSLDKNGVISITQQN